MHTILDEYRTLREDVQKQLHDHSQLTLELLCTYQELLYRIQVLESMQFLLSTAPISMDIPTLQAHYGALDALVSHLLEERKYRLPSTNTRAQNAFDTARRFLLSVVADYRKRFSIFLPEDDTHYQTQIADTIRVILPAWLQYRETMLKIQIKE